MPFSDPSFPVVNPNPTVDDCVKAMRWRDYFFVGGSFAGTWAYGYIFGKPARMPTASTASAIGLTFATFAVLQDTRARLMGYRENSTEVSKYGMHPDQPSLQAMAKLLQTNEDRARFPIATGSASPSTKPEIHWRNYN